MRQLRPLRAALGNPKNPVSRRRFLQSSLVTGGLSLSLADLLRLQAASRAHGGDQKDTAVIQVWLGGGPSQFETFDPKPEAPQEIRGPYGVIQTKFPGVLFCECMPLTAKVLDRAAIIRTVSHPNNNHSPASACLATGYKKTTGQRYPSVGSVVSHLRGANHDGLPPYVLLSQDLTRNQDIAACMGPGYLGAAHSPMTVLQDPFKDEFQESKLRKAVADFELASDLTLERVASRQALLGKLDRFANAAQEMEGVDHFSRVALDMISNGDARRAFDLSEESEATRRMYGSHRWGQMALLARRLVEAGTTFVTLSTAPDSLCWDWHLNIVNDKRPADGSMGPSRGMDLSGPPLDQMVSALVTDIYDRGLDKKVLLLVWGEFGRTPRINKTGGRDHWGPLMSILLAGGGLRVDQVIGTSNPYGEMPSERPVHPNEVLATVYRHLGIDPRTHTTDLQGRPSPLLSFGEAVAELL